MAHWSATLKLPGQTARSAFGPFLGAFVARRSLFITLMALCCGARIDFCTSQHHMLGVAGPEFELPFFF